MKTLTAENNHYTFLGEKFMKHLNILSLALISAALVSCSKDEVDLWSEENCAWFTEEAHTFSFRSVADVKEGESTLVAIPMTLATSIASHDRIVNVEVTQQPASPDTRCEIVTPVKVRAGMGVDTLWIKVFNDPHLNAMPDTIKFRIVDSPDFHAGLESKVNAFLRLYNGLARPSWWNKTCEQRALGKYNEFKHQVYIDCMGNDDDPRGNSTSFNASSNINIAYVLVKLEKYVADNNIVYPADYPDCGGRGGEAPRFERNQY